uniref:uncharacterized protein LOC122609076 n=1 Tax=Erigeron canadensis TaxID=72917 RepID=UPI001CB94EF2|nr:uncharacterized protein LOC122609076 [Erigeron canadensis]
MVGIVPEVFKEENYEFWKTCLKSYLVGHGLWDVIEREATPAEGEKSPEWKMKNARALHAIQLACGSQAYAKFKKKTHVSAKFAWDHLAELHPSPSLHTKDQHDQDVSEVQGHFQYEELYQAVEADDINQVNEILKKDPDAGKAVVSSHGDTALHIAILSDKMNIALALVEKMPLQGLETFNEFGATPLSLAAITGNIELARTMINKNHNLVSLRKEHNGESSLPVIVASMYGKKRMVQYLYSVTPKDVLDPENGLDGVLLLNSLITSELFDVASMLLKHFPQLGVIPDHNGNYALHILAHKPSAFASGSKFSFWKHWIYECVRIHSPWDADTQRTKRSNGSEHGIDIHDEEEFFKRPSLLHQLGWILLRSFGIYAILCTHFCI